MAVGFQTGCPLLLFVSGEWFVETAGSTRSDLVGEHCACFLSLI